MAPKNLAALLLLVAAVGQVRCAAVSAVVNGDALLLVFGVVPCSNGTSINAAAVPPFANASVQAVCGDTVVARATADPTGAFVLNLGLLTDMPREVSTSMLTGLCSAAVTTPLVACDVSQASAKGTLAAPLQPPDSLRPEILLGEGGVIITPPKPFSFIL